MYYCTKKEEREGKKTVSRKTREVLHGINFCSLVANNSSNNNNNKNALNKALFVEGTAYTEC